MYEKEREYAVYGTNAQTKKVVRKYVMAISSTEAVQKANEEYVGENIHFNFAKIRGGCNCGS